MRIQLALNVKDLEAAIDFYSKMFGVEVNKRKPGYANFAIDQPPLKLVLFESPDADESLNHLGVEVFGDEDVAIAAERLKANGMAELVEDETTCCYAKATKVWTTEPGGLRWEWYRVIEDSDSFGAAPELPAPEADGSTLNEVKPAGQVVGFDGFDGTGRGCCS